jgi:hypothetical protein
VIYVYAIAPGDAAAPDAAGLEDRPVETVCDGALAAFVSRDVSQAIEPGEAELWRHQEVVAALMGDAPVLPMRFGTLVAGEAELRAVLEARRADLVRSLALVRGRVELGVRALWPGDSGERPAGDTGRGFMLAKLEYHRIASRAAREVHAPLAELAVEATCRLHPSRGVAFASAYLVDRGYAGELERRAKHLGADHPYLRLVVTGPWPPYSFCGVGDE